MFLHKKENVIFAVRKNNSNHSSHFFFSFFQIPFQRRHPRQIDARVLDVLSPKKYSSFRVTDTWSFYLGGRAPFSTIRPFWGTISNDIAIVSLSGSFSLY